MFRGYDFINDLACTYFYKYKPNTNTNDVYEVKLSKIWGFNKKTKLVLELRFICDDEEKLKNYFYGEGEGCEVELIDSIVFEKEELNRALESLSFYEMNLITILKEHNMEVIKYEY